MQNKPHRFHGLDHLRALAIMLVFLFHYQVPIYGRPDWLIQCAKFGWIGVDLFFVLSGFLIASQLFIQIKEKQRLLVKDFFIKRIFRILPAYMVVLAIYVLWPFFHEREGLPGTWRFLTFTQNFGLNIKIFGTFSHAWSLCVEEHFYLLLPYTLILLLYTRSFAWAGWILLALFISGFFIRHFGFHKLYLPDMEKEPSWHWWYQYLYYPTYNRLDGLLAGVSIAGICQFYPVLFARITKYGNLLLVLSLIVLTGAYFLCEDQHSYAASVFGFPLVALGFGLMVLGAISPGSFLFKWNSPVTTFVAALSYAIYLSHKGIIHITQELFEPFIEKDSNSMLVICTILSITAAFVLNFLVEKPFMRQRKKLLQ
jgi:peptidoglycan/LPS O-acetylase OafA/YrhL